MDDASLVRRLERVSQLTRDGQHFVERQPRAGRCDLAEPFLEWLTFDQLENDGCLSVRFLETVDRRDIRVVQRGEQLRLALESRHAICFGDGYVVKYLDGDVAAQLRVARAIHFAHAAGSDEADDL